jgi:hypothetical protein
MGGSPSQSSLFRPGVRQNKEVNLAAKILSASAGPTFSSNLPLFCPIEADRAYGLDLHLTQWVHAR